MTRTLIINLLDDEYGIPMSAWKDIESICDDNEWEDIILSVRIQDGRAYLPENHDLG